MTCCSSTSGFAFLVGCILFAELLGMCYFKSVLTTIERRFSLSSTTTALLSSCFQIGNMTVMVLVSYFGSRYHRPRIIAVGCLLMAFGFALSTFPQFVGDRYEFVDISTNASDSDDEKQMTCHLMSNKTSEPVTCGIEEDSENSGSMLYLFVLVGIMIVGVGGSAPQPLGFSFIDDHATRYNAALYIGIVSTIMLIGPIVGFVMGAFTLKIWVDSGWIDTSTISIVPSHPGWVGAWWVGLLLTSVFLFISGLPLFFYPNKIAKEIEKTNDETKSRKPRETPDVVRASFKVKSGGIVDAFKRLFFNKRYILIVMLWTCESFRISGLSVFILKYLEIAFGKSASESSFLIGAVNLPFLVLGTIAGSLAIKQWKLEIVGITRISLISIAGSIASFGPLMFIGCETIDTAGLTVPYPGSQGNPVPAVLNDCNSACNCEENLYTPVCGPDGITYVTPCHAGCTEFSADEFGDIANYTACLCVGGSSSGSDNVRVGRCSVSNCEDFAWLVIAFKSGANFFGGLEVTPFLVMLIRSLQPQDKAFGIGMAFFTFRLLAYIPGPIIFGYVIDKSCLFWSQKPCSDRAYCSVYDNTLYRYGFFGLVNGAQIVGMIFATTYYYKYAKPDAKLTKNNENEGDQSAVGNGNGASALLETNKFEEESL